MECMSNACEFVGIRNALFNIPDDHAQVAVKGAYGTNYVIAQWVHPQKGGFSTILCTIKIHNVTRMTSLHRHSMERQPTCHKKLVDASFIGVN